jgi:hypothetical protein
MVIIAEPLPQLRFEILEAARILRLSRATFYQRIRAGQLAIPIAEVQPSFVHASADATSDKAIFGAWQTSNTILRLAKIAFAKHLPLWTTG